MSSNHLSELMYGDSAASSDGDSNLLDYLLDMKKKGMPVNEVGQVGRYDVNGHDTLHVNG